MDFGALDIGGPNRMHKENFSRGPYQPNTSPNLPTLYINVLNKRLIVLFIRAPTWRKIQTLIPFKYSTVTKQSAEW
jgi:hypothetical protein